MRSAELKVYTTKLLSSQEQISTEWFWESETVHMDTSPDFLESLSQPSLDVGYSDKLISDSSSISCSNT